LTVHLINETSIGVKNKLTLLIDAIAIIAAVAIVIFLVATAQVVIASHSTNYTHSATAMTGNCD
jgi:hypothetical protein